ASYDSDRNDPANATTPAVVRYADEGFSIVLDTWLGHALSPSVAADNALDGPFRLDVLPGGDLVIADGAGLRRFSPDGRPIELYGVRSYPQTSYRLAMDVGLTAATGEPGRVMGVGVLETGCLICLRRPHLELEVTTLGRTDARRYCRVDPE